LNGPFHHSPAVIQSWRERVEPLIRQHPTPFYLFSIVPMEAALAELQHHFGHLPVRHWLSCKTQPLRPLLQWWRRQGLGIEVVSEFEFLAALKEGYAPERILLNGPAKHHWLRLHPVRGLCVNLDSLAEARALLPLAKKLDWHMGVRLHTREEFDPETPDFPTQFGMTPDEVAATARALRREGVRLETVHFHLRTNVPSASVYERALTHLAEVCRGARLAPRYVDCGGGFPPDHVMTRTDQAVAAEFDVREMARIYERALKQFPSAQEIWLENGRWLSARSGVLVVKILDVKERKGMRHVICDGGRTLHALLASWEAHELVPLPYRQGPTRLTTVVGPTCMAFDQLARGPLPRRLRSGDHLLWLDAGAYHLSWETRFSHGLAAVFWHDGRQTKRVRAPEKFSAWWGQWK
jgi:diaminopimelate decarboxylase